MFATEILLLDRTAAGIRNRPAQSGVTIEPNPARVVVMACMLALVSVPAFAQIDLTGSWPVKMHEDWTE